MSMRQMAGRQCEVAASAMEVSFPVRSRLSLLSSKTKTSVWLGHLFELRGTRLAAHFLIWMENSDLRSGGMGLPVFMARIRSEELLGMVMAIGWRMAFSICSRHRRPPRKSG